MGVPNSFCLAVPFRKTRRIRMEQSERKMTSQFPAIQSFPKFCSSASFRAKLLCCEPSLNVISNLCSAIRGVPLIVPLYITHRQGMDVSFRDSVEAVLPFSASVGSSHQKTALRTAEGRVSTGNDWWYFAKIKSYIFHLHYLCGCGAFGRRTCVVLECNRLIVSGCKKWRWTDAVVRLRGMRCDVSYSIGIQFRNFSQTTNNRLVV